MKLTGGILLGAALCIGMAPPIPAQTPMLPRSESDLREAIIRGDVAVVGSLLEAHEQAGGARLLIEAAYHGQPQVVGLLLSRGFKPDATNAAGWTPLLAAASRGQTETIRLLLDAGADPSLAAPDGGTPLLLAAEAGAVPIIDLLIQKGASLDEKYLHSSAMRNRYSPSARFPQYPHDKTALHLAAINNRTNAVRRLIELGADVEAVDTGANTALHLAVAYGADGMARELLRLGANPNAGNIHGETPLTLSIRVRSHQVTDALLAGGADVNARVFGDRSPLVLAIESGNTNVIAVLLDRGAQIALRNSAGRSFFGADTMVLRHLEFLSARTGNAEVQAEWARLSAHRAEAEASSVQRVEPAKLAVLNQQLTDAARAGNVDLVRALLSQGADPNATNAFGWPALVLAADNGRRDVMAALIEKRGRIDVYERGKWTSVMMAAKNGDAATLTFLLEGNASILGRTSSGLSAIEIARGRGHAHLVALLEERGARLDAPRNLLQAAYAGDIPFLKLLLEDDELAPYYMPHISAALLHAASYGRQASVEFLLAKGADINYSDPNPAGSVSPGQTPLLAAMDSGTWPEMAQFLIRRGADVNKADAAGRTPLRYAQTQDAALREHFVRLLREAGAKQ